MQLKGGLISWKVIWHWEGPQRIRMFLWLAIQDGLVTNVERGRRHLTDFILRDRCKRESVTLLHALRDCPISRQQWIMLNLHKKQVAMSNIEWKCLFGEIRGAINWLEATNDGMVQAKL
ncbi:hypothetical protein RCOM_1158570 [Ricinus communis]|uniref:Reverse transcriptase zinc-binding domain-containing protein n=1 Tax=Ricinus communis TaxID=3988 RepID=B9SV59_RICCO|nr:hypothetical protein RCOM_1158570 [Ricinus communis]